MKVQIKQLKPNPFRDIKNYPIDEEKIQSLKESIEQTGFWDNILAREVDGKIQIAYGHHRLEALKQVMKPTDYVDIPVKKLDDATMIQIMANENMEQWKSSPSVVIETVKVTRNFLNAELAKYDSWEALNKSIKCLFEDEFSFKNTKGKGVGQTTILKFLGRNWKQWMIQEALTALGVIEQGKLKEKVVKELPSMQHVRKFASEARKDPSFTEAKQIEYAKEIKEQDIGKRQIDDFFIEKKYTPPKKKKVDEKENKAIKFENVIAETTNLADQFSEQLKLIIAFKEDFDNDYYRKTIVRFRLMLSIESIKNQFDIMCKTKS